MLGHNLPVNFFFFLLTLEADAQRSLSVVSGPLGDSLPMSIRKWAHWNSLVVQWLRFCLSKAGSVDLTPGQGTKTPQAVQCGQTIFFLNAVK